MTICTSRLTYYLYVRSSICISWKCFMYRGSYRILGLGGKGRGTMKYMYVIDAEGVQHLLSGR